MAKLIKQLGINRNTFYYYFKSKYDVAMYVFLNDLARQLRAHVPEDELVYLPKTLEEDRELLPYYMRREIGAHALDIAPFFKALVHAVMGRQGFYDKIFNDKEPEFRAMLDDLYRPAIEDDLRFVLGGRYMPPETFAFLTSTYLANVYLTPSYHLANPSQSEALLDERVNPFWNMPYESLAPALQKHPINRQRRP